MSMLTAAELAAAREDVLETLVSTCVIERWDAGTAGTAYGMVEQEWSAVGTVSCRVDPYTTQIDRSGQTAGRESMASYHIASFEWDEDIQPGDRVVFEGSTLEVETLWKDHSDRVLRRAILVQVEGD